MADAMIAKTRTQQPKPTDAADPGEGTSVGASEGNCMMYMARWNIIWAAGHMAQGYYLVAGYMARGSIIWLQFALEYHMARGSIIWLQFALEYQLTAEYRARGNTIWCSAAGKIKACHVIS